MRGQLLARHSTLMAYSYVSMQTIRKTTSRTLAIITPAASLTCSYMLKNYGIHYIIYSCLFDHLNHFQALQDEQHGFCRHRSCETQLILTVAIYMTLPYV